MSQNIIGVIATVFLIFPVPATSTAGAINHQPIHQYTATTSMLVDVTVSSAIDVETVVLFYRTVGDVGFIDVDMERIGEQWRGEIPLESLSLNGIEYFISTTLIDGDVITFPEVDPEEAPIMVQILQPIEMEVLQEPSESAPEPQPIPVADIESQILIFNPAPGANVSFDDVFIAASLFKIDSVDVSSIRIFVDGRDVTGNSIIGPNLVTYEPPSITSGRHQVRIELRTLDGQPVTPEVWSFGVTKEYVEEVEPEFTYTGRANSGYSLDRIDGGDPLQIGLTTASFNADWRDLRFKADFKITTEEDPFKQPRNRYRFSLDAGKYLSLDFGDFNSRISRFTLDGKRVRGIDGDLKLGLINLRIVRGELERSIQGRHDLDQSLYLDQILVTQNEEDSTKNDIVYKLNRKGFTFQRDIFAGRLSFGRGKVFQLGFNWLKARDDIGSVKRILDDAEITIDIDSSGTIPLAIPIKDYTYERLSQLIKSQNNYDLILDDKNWTGDAPQDNIVIGTDIKLSLFRRKISLEAGFAFSMLNSDIWEGAFTKAQLDTMSVLGDSISDGKIAGALDIPFDPKEFEDLFVLNLNLKPLLPIDTLLLFQDPLEAILKMPSAAYNFRATANLFGNRLGFDYIQVGPEFNSLGNPYIQTNNKEYTISDRLGLLRNRLLVNLSYRHQDDDILRIVKDVTTTNTFTANIGVYPGAGLPSITLTFRSQDRDNGKTSRDTVLVDTAKGRIELNDLRDWTNTTNTIVGISHQLDLIGLHHNVAVNYISLLREDQFGEERPSPPSFYTINSNGDSVFVDSSFVSPNLTSNVTNISIVTDYPLPLKTTVVLSINKSTFGMKDAYDGLYDYGDQKITSLTLNGEYTMLKNRLKLLGGVDFTTGSGVEEFSRLGIGAGFNYRITDVLRFRFDGKLRSKSTDGETKSSTLLRATLNYSF